MEKRLILAVLLMGAAIFVTNLLFPPGTPPGAGDAPAADSVAAAAPAQPARPAPALVSPPAAPPAAAEDTVWVSAELYRYGFSTRGATLVHAEMLAYPSYTDEGEPVQLVPPGSRDFLGYRLAVEGDTIDLRGLPFRAAPPSLALAAGGGPQALRFEYADAGGFGVELTYTFQPEGYLVGVHGVVRGLGGRRATLLTELGPGLELHEAEAHRAERELGVVTRSTEEIDRIRLADVEGTQPLSGALSWAAIRDKYFMAAVIAGDSTPLSGAVVRDLPDAQQRYPGRDEPVVIPRAQLTAALPVATDGTFALQAYVGPQEYSRLAAVGYELEEITPYAYRWLQPVIRPFAAAILWVLSFMHDGLGLAYGWALVAFGVLMRIVLWPLNAKAMRAQMKNMAVQPLMQEIRDKYKNDPEKQQAEMIRLYKEHGFNPLAGCLPLLIPFPVLITLFFVFQNTIAFRGAEFLWLPDLSLPDPLYLLPVVLVVSAFGLQWVSMHLGGMEANPQMKMMMYVMPLVMGVIFFALPAGLNLYYAVTQVASIPQQVQIAKERRKAQAELKKSGPPPAGKSGGTRSGGRRPQRG